MLAHRSSPIVHKFRPKFTCIFDHSNVVAAAAAAAASTKLSGAVSSAISHVAVSALAIASGACLSTKIDFLWPKLDDQPG